MEVGRTKDWIAAAVICRSSALLPLLQAGGYAAVVPSNSRATTWALIRWTLLMLILILLQQLLLMQLLLLLLLTLLPLLQAGGYAAVVPSNSRATAWALIRWTLLLLILILLLLLLLLLWLAWSMVAEFVVVILVEVHNVTDSIRKTGVTIAVAVVGAIAAEAAISVVMVGGGGWMAFANTTRFS